MFYLRKAKQGDISSILSLIDQYTADHILLPRTAHTIEVYLQDFTVAEIDGEILGTASLHALSDTIAEIRSVAIKKEHAGNGIANALFLFLLQEAKKRQCRWIVAKTLQKKFFSKLGFQFLEEAEFPRKALMCFTIFPKEKQEIDLAYVQHLIEEKRREEYEKWDIAGGVCAPQGFKACGIASGIKSTGQKDLALISSDTPATAAGVFTQNLVKAAPVLVTQKALEGSILQAIIINSGNANACTGERGMLDAHEMCAMTAQALHIEGKKIAVASTGVIGVFLPMDKIEGGLFQAATQLRRSSCASREAACAIMTTDTVPKEIAMEISIDGVLVRLGAIGKGSGMVHPQMATVLAFVTTDAAITQTALQCALKEAVDDSLNMVSVDKDTSTNDMVLILANGSAGNPQITQESSSFLLFKEALKGVLIEIAKSIARDGEGATKLFEVQITGAETVQEARMAARSISSSSLVKAALFGEDPNWGRILCSLGYSGARFNPSFVDLHLNELPLMQSGTPMNFDMSQASQLLAQKHVLIKVDLKSGPYCATAWGCDLSHDYVTINARCRT